MERRPPGEDVHIAIDRCRIAIVDGLLGTQLDNDTHHVAVRTQMPGVTSDMIEWRHSSVISLFGGRTTTAAWRSSLYPTQKRSPT
jgi:hypothetical protein